MNFNLAGSVCSFLPKDKSEVVTNLMSSRIVAASRLMSRTFVDSTNRILDSRSGLSSSMGKELRIGTVS